MISSGGKVVTLVLYGPGEIFGEWGLASDGPRQHSAWTTTSAIIAELPVVAFQEALQSSPKALLDAVGGVSLDVDGLAALQNLTGEVAGLDADRDSGLPQVLPERSDMRREGASTVSRSTDQDRSKPGEPGAPRG